MLHEHLINNWSDALVELATDNLDSQSFVVAHEAIRSLYLIFRNNPSIMKFMSSHIVAAPDRKTVLSPLQNMMDLNPWLYNALLLMIDNQIFYLCPAILKAVGKKMNAQSGLYYGRVLSVVPLTAAEMATLNQKITNKLDYKVILVNEIDSSLIGGIKVIVKNYIYDGTVRTKLEALQQRLLKTPYH